MNLILIGYRGAGKSSVGRLLAERLGWDLISTDAEIVRKAGLPIPDIVQRFGWDHFRNLESAVCRELADKDHLIIDTGGGAILRPENVDSLKATGSLVWLRVEVRTIIERIGGDTQRPSLTGAKSFTDEVEEVLRERQPKYQAAADHIVATDEKSLSEVADTIMALLQTRSSG
ncbi:shikimate kinase [Nitrospiraceae bacterium AH_259_D15_M11_P09]|nr:shikimate kinase [Nitrospiraceae bacterium AH_259_D15_M11_P09]